MLLHFWKKTRKFLGGAAPNPSVSTSLVELSYPIMQDTVKASYGWLLLSKAFSLLNSIVHLLNKLFIAAVRRQVKPVEARVTARKPRLLANLLYTEMLRTVTS